MIDLERDGDWCYLCLMPKAECSCYDEHHTVNKYGAFGFIKKIKKFLVSADQITNGYCIDKPVPDEDSLRLAFLKSKVSLLEQENHELKRTIEVMETLTGYKKEDAK